MKYLFIKNIDTPKDLYLRKFKGSGKKMKKNLSNLFCYN